jgi:hypothetical protein
MWPAIKALSATGARLSTLADAHQCAAAIASMPYLERPYVVALSAARPVNRRLK